METKWECAEGRSRGCALKFWGEKWRGGCEMYDRVHGLAVKGPAERTGRLVDFEFGQERQRGG